MSPFDRILKLAELANQVLLIAERLSYRQLCLIPIIARHNELDFDTTTWNRSSLLRFEPGRATKPRNRSEYIGFARELLALSSEREAILSYRGESEPTAMDRNRVRSLNWGNYVTS